MKTNKTKLPTHFRKQEYGMNKMVLKYLVSMAITKKNCLAKFDHFPTIINP